MSAFTQVNEQNIKEVLFKRETSGFFSANSNGLGQGELAGYSFRTTFTNTPADNGIRRSADIWSGFNGGAWGKEFLAFGVGNNGAPNDAVNMTSEKMRIDSAGNLKFNSGYGSAATAYGCRAWVNFYGTGTVGIRASGNVSSITDNGVGDYRVNFTTAMPDANYSVGNGPVGIGSSVGSLQISTYNTTSVRVFTHYSDNNVYDWGDVFIQIFR